MSPDDIIWRLLERLQESKQMIAGHIDELDKKRHGDLIDALFEVEQLTQTQLNVLNRMRRRYG